MSEGVQLRIALIGTVDRPKSHTDVIVSRWLEPRPGDAAWGWPRRRTRIASAYLDQFPHNDLGRERCRKHGVPLYATIREALCMGGDRLAVDGVLIIGEHGAYPFTDIGQHEYPRKRLFDEVVAVFRASGRTAPVFCDKHYSWHFPWAQEMHETAQRMGFMLFGGSSVPLCRRQPAIRVTANDRVTRAGFVYYEGDEAYGYHSMEFAQSLLEHRAGGETGIRSVTAWRGIEAWRQYDRGRWHTPLTAAAAQAIAAVDPEDVTGNDLRRYTADPTVFLFEYVDGMQVSHVNLQQHVRGWGAAIEVAGESSPRACAPIMTGEAPDYFAHFATLARVIEDTFISGRPPFSTERSLFTTGAIAAAMEARSRPGETILTPHLHISYKAIEPLDPFA